MLNQLDATLYVYSPKKNKPMPVGTLYADTAPTGKWFFVHHVSESEKGYGGCSLGGLDTATLQHLRRVGDHGIIVFYSDKLFMHCQVAQMRKARYIPAQGRHRLFLADEEWETAPITVPKHTVKRRVDLPVLPRDCRVSQEMTLPALVAAMEPHLVHEHLSDYEANCISCQLADKIEVALGGAV